MKTILIGIKDYERIKNGEEILMVVEAKGEHPIYVNVSAYSQKSSNDCSNYENAVFNGECD